MSAKTVGYARVSTADQSLDVQVMQLEFAACDKIFSEKASGADDNRRELARALQYVQKGDTLVICKLDRIARSTRHLLEVVDILEKRGVAFRVLNISLDTSTPTGKMMLTILGAVATFEREILLERQAEGIKRARAAGVYKGRAPVIRDAHTERVLARRAEGIPHRDIATECGIGVATVYRICAAARQAPVLQQATHSGAALQIAGKPTGRTGVATVIDDPWQEPELPMQPDPMEAMRKKYGWVK